jgi:hypothetical protein
MNAANPSAAVNVEKGNIHTADNCMSGVMTVLDADENAHRVAKYAEKWKHPPIAASIVGVSNWNKETKPVAGDWTPSLQMLTAITLNNDTNPLSRAFCSGDNCRLVGCSCAGGSSSFGGSPSGDLGMTPIGDLGILRREFSDCTRFFDPRRCLAPVFFLSPLEVEDRSKGLGFCLLSVCGGLLSLD